MVIQAFPALAAVAVAGFGLLRPVAPAFRLRDERPRDASAREALLDASFGPSRFAKTCERLREGRLPADGSSFVAVDGGAIVGTLRFWHVECGRVPALMLGPLAVAASHRSAGIGGALIAHGLRRAARLGHGGVVLVGDAPYYARFGFARAPVEHLVLPGPVDAERFLGLELRPGGLAGARGRVAATGLIVGERRDGEPLRRAA
ncbi:N-acetyltransferase [Lichenibacterium minor]|uniref:N-acetyltransferase n=1 Tax=Lichenibacterium minor TaxID=2316528 RepID=A0A4Q2U7F2_9HYPH|nr:N-acetyltransferase [Lichenibacterium minor]RYC32619.1 N-acetyltransferase [Lichenibacterium minor]